MYLVQSPPLCTSHRARHKTSYYLSIHDPARNPSLYIFRERRPAVSSFLTSSPAHARFFCGLVIATILLVCMPALPSAIQLPKIAVLYDPNISDLRDDGSGEAYNLVQTLSWWGYSYNTIGSNALAEWQAALSDAQVLVFPEPGEKGLPKSDDPLNYMGLSVINQVRMWVAIGGLFIQLGDNLTIIPYIFNMDWPIGGSSQDPSVPTTMRASSVFANCSYSLAGLDLVYHYNSSLVNTSLCLQYKTSADSGCTLLQDSYGQGTVTWIGFDWYQARPIGTQDGGWLQVFRSALSEAPPPPPSPTNTPSSSPTPSISTSSSPSESPSASISHSPSPTSTPSHSKSPSNTPCPTPSPSVSSSPSNSQSPSSSSSNSPSTSPSQSTTPSISISITPSRTPSRSATPTNTPAPATGNYADLNTQLFFFSRGPNVRVVEGTDLPDSRRNASCMLTNDSVASNISAILTFEQIILFDGSGHAVEEISLPQSTCLHEKRITVCSDRVLLFSQDQYQTSTSSYEDVVQTGLELFGFSSVINSVPIAFNFTHPVFNDTLFSFANIAYVVERGAVKWLFTIDGGWPFSSSIAEFSLVVNLALGSAPVNLVKRINAQPRQGLTTYSINDGQLGGSGGKSLDLRLVVFDMAVADSEVVEISHQVTLLTDDNGGQIAQFSFTFPAFQYSFTYDPKLVLIINAASGDSSPGGLIAGAVVLIIIGGMVLIAITRANAASPPEPYRGSEHLPVPTEEIEPFGNGTAEFDMKSPRSKTVNTFGSYEDEYENDHNGYNGLNDIEMELLDAEGRKKGKEQFATVQDGSSQARRPRPPTVLVARGPAATHYQWQEDQHYDNSYANGRA